MEISGCMFERGQILMVAKQHISRGDRPFSYQKPRRMSLLIFATPQDSRSGVLQLRPTKSPVYHTALCANERN